MMGSVKRAWIESMEPNEEPPAECSRWDAEAASTLRGLLERMNHDAVPAAIAPADSHAPRGAVDRESVGTDKAEPLNRDCGTGNTTDRPQPVKDSDFDRSKPIRDARLAALEELSALDQKLELEYGLVGNPMIKAQQRTPDQQPTPGECSLRNGCVSGRETVR